jgi:hypothetical protein
MTRLGGHREEPKATRQSRWDGGRIPDGVSILTIAPANSQTVEQILPVGIEAVDQFNLVLPRACLDLLLAGDRRRCIVGAVVVDEFGDIVAISKARDQLLTMLICAPLQFTVTTSIKNGVPLVGHDVNAVLLLHHTSVLTMSLRGAEGDAAIPAERP